MSRRGLAKNVLRSVARQSKAGSNWTLVGRVSMQLMKRTLKKVRYTYIRRPHRKKAMICIDSVGYYMVSLYSVCIRWKSEKIAATKFQSCACTRSMVLDCTFLPSASSAVGLAENLGLTLHAVFELKAT